MRTGGRDATRHSGDDERIAVSEAIGGTLRSSHMNGDRIYSYIGRRHQVEDEGDPAWVIFLVDDANSIEFHWNDDGEKCKTLTS